MSRNKSSPVWAHFELQVTQKSVKCKICHDVLSYNGSTGTMLNHMKRHPTARTNNQENVQSSILPYVISNASQTRKCNNVRKEEIDQLLCEMIVGDMLPLDFVQSPYFLRLIHFLEPEYKVPCVKRFVHLLENKYNNARNALKDEIGEANTVALTTDCWTSLTTEAYMTVTCHFVTPDWKLRSVVLCTESTQDERHTGENLAARLEQIALSWNLPRIVALVHDNASNIIRANDLLTWPSLCCFAHTLNLSIVDAFKSPSLNQLVTKFSRLVSHFHHSTVATKALESAQSSIGLPSHRLQQYCKTRWNSVYHMVKRTVEQRLALIMVLSNRDVTSLKDARLLEITEEQWTLAQDILPLLHSLECVSDILCGENYPTASIVYPITTSLLTNHLSAAEGDSAHVEQMKSTISSSLRRRMKLDDSNIVKSPALMASLMDPRHKHLRFMSEAVREAAKRELRKLVGLSKDQPTPLQPEVKKSKLDFILGNDYHQQAEDDVDEIVRYFREAVASPHSSPLEWWKANELNYPNLCNHAKQVLCIPASSVPSERVFSAAGLLINRLRCRLSSEHVDMLLFLYKSV